MGILQQPFFDLNWPTSLNYGRLGAIVGHELSHSFDSQGVQWNGAGRLKKWMKPQSLQTYAEVAECIANQYKQFCPLKGTPPECLNGTNTREEDVADNAGRTACFPNNYLF